ncbi:MAG TPA: DUF362 domain-containing protein, partial [Armatimonadetes bacterium]|nr:DUF362 domain-containing protein [Armatimonadota bacterium]
MNRRQFLQWIAGAVALGGWQTTAKFDTDARIAGVTGALQRRPQEGKTKVVVARHPRLYKLPDDKPPHTLGMRTLYETIFELLEAGMLELTNARSWADAWRKFVKPTDVVGIKVNCIAGASLSSNPMLVNAIVAGLRSAGVPYSRIIVWDRSTRELSRAGFKVRMRPPGVLCYGTDAVGYRKQLSSFGEVATRVSNIVAEQCTVLINVPVLKTHYLSGLTAALKNHYGSI